MNTSILNTIKQMLGLASDYTVFDTDIIVHINTSLSILRQLGVGPSQGFSITGATETWGNFLGTATNLEEVKTYIYLKVKKLFDPPSNSSLVEAYNNEAKELEWRMNVTVDPGDEISEV